MQFNSTNYAVVDPQDADLLLLRQDSSGDVKTTTILKVSQKAAVSSSLSVATISALRALDSADFSDGQPVNLLGYSAEGDGGGGQFVFDPTSALADNGGTIIAPTSNSGRWLRAYGSTIDLRWFGGTANALASALVALPSGGTILLNPDGNTVLSQITIPTNGESYIIQGNGAKCFVTRDSTYSAGDVFYIGAGAAAVFRDFTIQNAEGFQNTSGYAFNFTGVTNSTCAIERVWIYNGKNGIKVSGSSDIWINKVYFLQSSSQVAAGFGATAALYVTGLSGAIYVNDCAFVTQAVTSTNALEYGILLDQCDGVYVSNTPIKAQRGVGIAMSGSNQVTNIYFVNCTIDECMIQAVAITGSTTGVFQNVRFLGCHMVGYNRSTETDGIALGVAALRVFILADCNISGWRGNGVAIGAGQFITIDNCVITDVDAADLGTWGVLVSGGSNIKISGGVMGAVNQSPAVMNGAVSISGASVDYVSITGVQGVNTQGEPFSLVTTPDHLEIKDCFPLGSLIPTIASGASVTLSMYDTIKISGTTTLVTINGGWSGRVVRLVFTNAAPGGVATGGNVSRTQTAAQNQVITLTYDGTNWY